MTAKRIEQWWITCDEPGCGRPYKNRAWQAFEGWQPDQFAENGWTTTEGTMRDAYRAGATTARQVADVMTSMAKHYCPDHTPGATA